MSVVGLDFGSHAASISLWYEETDKVDVIADDLGFRTIPCAVAFRVGEEEVEIITGQAAVAQAHKNPKNTFLDVRKLLEDDSKTTVHVPVLDKDITVTELASHFFRNIHNQVKQQIGKAVRETVVSVPASLCEDGAKRSRMIEAAQMGGVRIKSTITDTAAVLNAHKFDDVLKNNSETVAIVDLGWSRTEIQIVTCTGGMYFPKSVQTTDAMSGLALVNALTTHCTKDFMRKAKFPLDDNVKSMTRLRNECEVSMKNLSTASEAQLDMDSLCEGVDYSVRISKARFEDLGGIHFMQLNNLAKSALAAANMDAGAVTCLVLAGGLSGIPKCVNVLQSAFPNAVIKRTRGLEMAEAQAVGAALQARHLCQLQLLDRPPAVTAAVTSACINSSVSISSGSNTILAMPAGSVLPARYEMTGECDVAGGCFKILVESNIVGELVFRPDVAEGNSAKSPVVVVMNVNLEGKIDVEVRQSNTELVLASLVI